jgi:3-isopropylmalate dehydrogenase
MDPACKVATVAASKYDNTELVAVPAPMGWTAHNKYGDTLPVESLETAKRIGTVFFGGIGDDNHNYLAVRLPDQRPERRVLLGLRQGLGLLINRRPAAFWPELRHLAGARPDRIPAAGMTIDCLRFLLQDIYFGSADLGHLLSAEAADAISLVQKANVTGKENRVSMLGYYDRASLELYFHNAFQLARKRGLPVVNVDKSNITPCCEFWRRTCIRIRDEFYSDVPLSHLYIDDACAALFNPVRFGNCIVTVGNVFGDIFTDTAAVAAGSMGMMCSSSVNPITNAALFETGSGTAPKLKGKNVINPLGSFLTAAMMLQHKGLTKAGNAIEQTIRQTLQAGYRTIDFSDGSEAPGMVLGTMEMTQQILNRL